MISHQAKTCRSAANWRKFMKRSLLKITAILLLVFMLVPVFSSCSNQADAMESKLSEYFSNAEKYYQFKSSDDAMINKIVNQVEETMGRSFKGDLQGYFTISDAKSLRHLAIFVFENESDAILLEENATKLFSDYRTNRNGNIFFVGSDVLEKLVLEII